MAGPPTPPSPRTPTNSRDIRRCAVQALYQMDAQREAATPAAAPEAPPAEPITRERLLESLEESPGDRETHKRGLDLALQAWALREEADRACAALSPDWPTHRQPMLDRSILRLAYFEITTARTPPKVAINEAVELAREFSTEKSPSFINGVLDKIMKTKSKGQQVGTSKEET
jgi:N utilization substance protein B